MEWSKEHIIFSIQYVLKNIKTGNFSVEERPIHHSSKTYFMITNNSNITIKIFKRNVTMILSGVEGDFYFSRLFWKDKEVKSHIYKLKNTIIRHIEANRILKVLEFREACEQKARDAIYKTFQNDLFEKEILGDKDGKEE